MGGARAPVLCFVLVIFSFLCFFGESTEEVRLVGDLFGTGRLEVLYTQNETVRAPVWGSVCSDKFDSADAEVACTHMGRFSEESMKPSFMAEGDGWEC